MKDDRIKSGQPTASFKAEGTTFFLICTDVSRSFKGARLDMVLFNSKVLFINLIGTIVSVVAFL